MIISSEAKEEKLVLIFSDDDAKILQGYALFPGDDYQIGLKLEVPATQHRGRTNCPRPRTGGNLLITAHHCPKLKIWDHWQAAKENNCKQTILRWEWTPTELPG